MLDNKLKTAWPAALGTFYVGIAKNPTAPYTVAHIIDGQPNGHIKTRTTTTGHYLYQVDVYTALVDKATVINAINTLYNVSTFKLIKFKYVSSYSEKPNLHRHIIELTLRDIA